jgi:hypothetical protein
VSRAITWFFEQVEEGIILEDDCVPHPDFFPYCATLLERYRHDTRVWSITGRNDQKGRWIGAGSYYFSRYPHCWGWASWRHRWAYYDSSISLWHKAQEQSLLDNIFEDQEEIKLRTNIYNSLSFEGLPDTWDYQWSFCCFINSGLTATPNRNVVANIGFGLDATHTTHSSSHAIDPKGLPNIIHPDFVVRDVTADRFMFTSFYAKRQSSRNWLRLPLFRNGRKLFPRS